jgi:O-antigen ligase
MNISFISLLILIVWLPLPYGSNPAWAWALMEIAIFSLALLWLWQYLKGENQLTPVFYKAIPILLLWSVWLIYISFQLIPLPYSWVQWLSPQAAQVHAFTNPSLITLSVNPHSTAVGLLKSFSYVILFTLTLLMVNTRTRLRWIALALLISGLFQALYGSVMTLSGLEYGFLHEKVFYRGVATGTFINRNHLAGYLVMCLSVGIGLLIAQLGGSKATYSTWRERIAALLTWIMSTKMLLRLGLVFMVIALVLTHSRMGNTAFFASMMIAGIIALSLSRHANRTTVILLVSLIVIDIFIVGAWFGLEKVTQRLEQTSLATETRDEIDVYTFSYWQDYFWTGSGLGSYQTAFPRYQGADVEGHYVHAHNDYLEFAAETGLIGLMLLGFAILLTLGIVLVAMYRRHNALSRGIAFSVTMAITALLIHSSVDFNLQIPANAATFMLILALGWVACYLPRQTSRSDSAELPKHKHRRRAHS